MSASMLLSMIRELWWIWLLFFFWAFFGIFQFLCQNNLVGNTHFGQSLRERERYSHLGLVLFLIDTKIHAHFAFVENDAPPRFFTSSQNFKFLCSNLALRHFILCMFSLCINNTILLYSAQHQWNHFLTVKNNLFYWKKSKSFQASAIPKQVLEISKFFIVKPFRRFWVFFLLLILLEICFTQSNCLSSTHVNLARGVIRQCAIRTVLDTQSYIYSSAVV